MAQQTPNLETLWRRAPQANRREDHTSCSLICNAILSQPGLTLFELGQTSNVLSRLPVRLGARDHADRAIELFGRVLRGDSGFSDEEQIWAMMGMATVMERSVELRGEGEREGEREGDEEGEWDEDEGEDDGEGTIEGKELGREKPGQQESQRPTREDAEHPQVTTTATNGALEDGEERHSEVGEKGKVKTSTLKSLSTKRSRSQSSTITARSPTQEAPNREQLEHQRRKTQEASQRSEISQQENRHHEKQHEIKAQVLGLRIGVWRVSSRARSH